MTEELIMEDYKEAYDKIDLMRFYLKMRDNVLFVRYLDQLEEFINKTEVKSNEQQRAGKDKVTGTEA